MKKVIIILTMLFGVFNHVEAAPTIVITAKVKIARPKKDCLQGLWVCPDGWDIKVESGRAISVEISDSHDGNLTFIFNSQLPETGSFFYADEDESVSLSAEICKGLGYSSVRLVPGNYKISQPSSGNYGSVTIKAVTR